MLRVLPALTVFVFLLSGGGLLHAQGTGRSKDYRVFRDSHFRSGYYFYNRRNYQAAIPFFEKALSLDPRHFRSRLWLGQSYFMAGFYKNALTEWQIALNLGAGGNLLKSKLNYLYYLQGKENPNPETRPYIYLRRFSGFRKRKIYFNRPAGVAVANDNRLFVAGFKSGSLSIMDPNGNIVKTLRAGLKKPYDVAVTADGSVYVSDFGADQVLRFDRDLQLKARIGKFGYRPGQFSGPEGICVDGQGNLFVVDAGNNRVQKFSPGGEFLLQFGHKGTRRGQFFRPVDVAVASNGRIYVSDLGNNRIQTFDESGNYLTTIGTNRLERPRGLHIMRDGRLAVADERRGVLLYNPRYGSWERLEALTGKVLRAVGLCSDRNNLLYVADFDSYQVNIFVPEHLKYVNLDVRITRTLEFDFPRIQHFLTVRDREGRPILGLKRKNFRVYERGILLQRINLTPTYRHKTRTAMVFVVDKSRSMEPHAANLKRVMRGILQTLPGRDRVAVINCNDKAWISQKFIGNVLSPLAGAEQGRYSERALIGQGMYKGITETFRYDYRPALVLFTTADFQDADYAPYGYKTCLHYARNNGVPVYVVLFGSGADTARLGNLAAETGGEVFDALTSNAVYSLRRKVMQRPLHFYSIFYQTVAHPRMRGTFREFTVEVRYKGLFGYDKFGYYIKR